MKNMIRALLVLCVVTCWAYNQNTIQFTLSDDPIIRQYVDVLYDNQYTNEPIYLLNRPSTLFFESQQKSDELLYVSTGYVLPEFKITESESGVCMTYGTYFLIHEVYLDYLLENPEKVIFKEMHKDVSEIEHDIASQVLSKLPPYAAQYLADICKDGDVFVERASYKYCTHPSEIIKNNTDEGVTYVISTFFGEMLFKFAQQDILMPDVFNDALCIYRLFNDRSHWTPLSDEQEAFFNEHKDDPYNGDFLSEKQMSVILKKLLEKGLFAGLVRNQGVKMYVDLSGFMTHGYNYALLVCNTHEVQPCFIVSPYLIHLIGKLQAKPFFADITPTVSERLAVTNN